MARSDEAVALMAPTVLMVNDVATVGGGQTVMLDVAGALLGASFEVHIACPPGPLADDARRAGAQWHDFTATERRMLTPRARLPRPAAAAARWREGRALAHLAGDIGADIVHSGALVPHLDLAAAKRSVRAKTVWHLNQMHPSYLFGAPLPDRIISVSRAALAPGRWRRAVAERSVVVPNAVDLQRFHPASSAERASARAALDLGDAPTVITVARLEPLKGVDTLLRAVAQSRVRPTILVVGDSTGYSGGEGHATDLRALAERLHVDARFLGARRDLPDLLAAADVLALASRWEAFGLVLAEASAAGLPVVSSSAGGCGEVVVDGATGVLVDPEDVAGFARAFDALLDDPQRRADLGQAGRRHAEEAFDLRRLAERLLPAYTALAALR